MVDGVLMDFMLFKSSVVIGEAYVGDFSEFPKSISDEKGLIESVNCEH